MHNLARAFAILLFVPLVQQSSASSLTVNVKHDVVVVQGERRQQFRVLFAEDELVADITLNVYVLEQFPSSKAHDSELRNLQDKSWLDSVQWQLQAADGRPTELPSPVILAKSVRSRGPSAARPADRDTTVPMTTYHAGLAFGSIPPGDYVLQASIGGLSSRFPFVVRTGSEEGFTDHYLRLKAMRTRDYATFRRLQLTRLESNPARLDALYDLIDRALVQGTLAETNSYFDRAIAAAEAGVSSIAEPARKRNVQEGVAQLRAVQRTLPDYYQNRGRWVMARDTKDGHYSIRSRASGDVIRDFPLR